MGRWKNDAELFELMRERLYTPVAGDILDAMGYSRQFLPAYIMPLRDEMKLAGRACTVLEQNVFEPQKKPFGLLTEALDQLKRDEVYLATGAANSALWGELLTPRRRQGEPPGRCWTDIPGTRPRFCSRISRYLPRAAGRRTPSSGPMWWISAAALRSGRW